MPAQRFSTALQTRADWDTSAQFIGLDASGKNECPWLRKSFNVADIDAQGIMGGGAAAATKSALLTVASIGWHEAYVNGHRLEASSMLIPSVSDYSTRVLSHQYDVAPYLKGGDNVLAFWLAPGWSALTFPKGTFNISKAPLVMAQLSLADLRVESTPEEVVLTTSSVGWKGTNSNIAHIGGWQWGITAARL
jgi:hypothetical protein